MPEILSPDEFRERVGGAKWRAGADGAVARFATGSFARGVEFVREIGRLADAANHHPDVELTYPAVTVRLVTHDAGNRLTEYDASLAAAISRAAADMHLDADPAD